jgi:hypothetical protein
MEIEADIEEKVTGSEEKNELTPEQKQDIVEKYFNNELDPNAAPEFQKKEPETPQAAEPETPSQTPASEPAQQLPTPASEVDVDSLKQEFDTLKQRYENAVKKITEQGMELGRFRAQPPAAAPAQPYYAPQPVFVPPVQATPEEPFDFSDPNVIAKLARREAARIIEERTAQEREQRNREQTANWQGTVTAQKQRLSVEMNVPEPVLDDAISRFDQDIRAGNVPAMAYVWINRDAIIQDAEKRGEARALAKLQAAQNQPRRAAASASGTATVTGKSIAELSIPELAEEAKKLPTDSQRRNDIMEILMGVR